MVNRTRKAIVVITTTILISIAILDAMTDEELDNPEKINGQAKLRISASAGCQLEKVSLLVSMHKQSTIMQQWLLLK